MTKDIKTDIDKSSRHNKIIGDFGEHLICNWLSRSGFEVTIVDHTGIDIIAYKPEIGRLGITVKSRTRTIGTENTNVNLFSDSARQKIDDACETFACKAWIAVYVETTGGADACLTAMDGGFHSETRH